MKRHFDEELVKVQEQLFRMGLLVEAAVQQAVQALFSRDSEKAQQVIRNDQEINLREIEIDEQVHELIALYQPTAVDLRLLTMTLKITNVLERMGDQAVNIAEAVFHIQQQPLFKAFDDFPQMTEGVTQMVRQSLTAFMEKDADKAKAVLESDDTIDQLNHRFFDEIQKNLVTRPDQIRIGVGLMLVSHNLERIADLATNIAEDVIYLKRGIDVRHHIRERRTEGGQV